MALIEREGARLRPGTWCGSCVREGRALAARRLDFDVLTARTGSQLVGIDLPQLVDIEGEMGHAMNAPVR